MAQPVLTIQRHYLDWPLGQSIVNSELINQFGIKATSDGRDLTDKITFNLTQVNINQQGEYPIAVTVMDSDGQTASDHLTLNVKPREQVQSQSNQGHQSTALKRHHRGWLVALIVLLAIIIVWWQFQHITAIRISKPITRNKAAKLAITPVVLVS